MPLFYSLHWEFWWYFTFNRSVIYCWFLFVFGVCILFSRRALSIHFVGVFNSPHVPWSVPAVLQPSEIFVILYFACGPPGGPKLAQTRFLMQYWFICSVHLIILTLTSMTRFRQLKGLNRLIIHYVSYWDYMGFTKLYFLLSNLWLRLPCSKCHRYIEPMWH